MYFKEVVGAYVTKGAITLNLKNIRIFSYLKQLLYIL